jgi:hypothetical protein
MAAQAAAALYAKACEMLSEGKAEIDKFKKTTEKAVGDAKAIYKEVTGIWAWISKPVWWIEQTCTCTGITSTDNRCSST